MRSLGTCYIGQVAAILVVALSPPSYVAAQVSAFGVYDDLRDHAEMQYEQGSFSDAQKTYMQVAELELTDEQTRWVMFRLADTQWRSHAGTQAIDAAEIEDARRQLEDLIPDSPQDRILAETHESLGDLHRLIGGKDAAAAAWPNDRKALEHWAAEQDVELARRRYLTLTWRMTDADENLTWGASIAAPLEVLENATRISVEPRDIALSNYLLAMKLQANGTRAERRRIEEAFKKVIDQGNSTPWYDDALYFAGRMFATEGHARLDDEGQRRQEPDYERAVSLFRRLVHAFGHGDSRYRDDARLRIREIIDPQLTLNVANVFRPGLPVSFDMRFRNVGPIEVALNRVDLTRDLDPPGGERSLTQWTEHLRVRDEEPLIRWTIDTSDFTAHRWGRRTEAIDPKPPVGAYLLTAAAGGLVARELVLVTDVAMVLKSWNGRTLAYVCDATTGAPVSGARLHLWYYRYDRKKWAGQDEIGRTDGDGLCRFEVDATPRTSENTYGMLVTANFDGHQAFAVVPRLVAVEAAERWRVHTIATRDRYRHGDSVSWKTTMRLHDGTSGVTPAERRIRYAIRGPHGVVHQGKLRLSPHGTAWGEAEVKTAWPAGEYVIDFTIGEHTEPGLQPLFEVIDSNPPPFTATISVAGASGRDVILLGDRLDIDVETSDEFGRAMPDASVELVVTHRPFDPQWSPPETATMAATTTPVVTWQGPSKPVEVSPVRTDSTGRVRVTINTPGVGVHDLAYRVEARVTNAAGVTVTAIGAATVMRRAVTCFLHPRTRVSRPGEMVEFDLHTLATPDRAVSAGGSMRVVGLTQDTDEPEAIVATTVSTDDRGNGRFSVTPTDVGHYRVSWQLEGDASSPVMAVADFWVIDDSVNDLEDAPDELRLIVDRSSYSAGDRAHCLIGVPTADQYVLLTVEGSELYHERLVHLSGTDKRVELPIDLRAVPDVTLQAMMIVDGAPQVARYEVSVPSTDAALDVALRSDHSVRRPGDRVTLEITTRTLSGAAVAAEVAVIVSPEGSVLGGAAYDPSRIFHTDHRPVDVQTTSTFSEVPYARVGQITIDPKGHAPRARTESRWSRLRAKHPIGERPRPNVIESALVKPHSTPEAIGQPILLWQPSVLTDENGSASITFTLPDEPLRWRATVIAINETDAVGIATTTGRSRHPLVARLRAPAYLVASDQVTVRGVFENHTDDMITVRPALEVEGATITAHIREGRPVSGETAIGALDVPAHESRIVDWLLAADVPGTATLALTGEDPASSTLRSHTMQVHEHGVAHHATSALRLTEERETVSLDIPKIHLRSSSLTVGVSAGTLTAAIDALSTLTTMTPSTVDGIVDQLVAFVVLTHTLDRLGADPKLYLDGFPGLSRDVPPLVARSRYVKRRIDDLLAAQRDDGGWGWHPEGSSDQIMSAYALWGLCEARVAGVEVDSDPMEAAAAYLDGQIVDVDTDTAHQAWMLAALAAYQWMSGDRIVRPARRAALDNLWRKRDRLDASLRSLAASAAEIFGDHERAVTLIRTLENGAIKEQAPEARPDEPSPPTLVHWGELEADTHWTRGAVETTALAIRAFMTVMGDHELRAGAAHWLLANRDGAGWATDRETTLAIVALALAYREGEDDQVRAYEVAINGGGPITRSADPRRWRTARGGERFDVTTLHAGTNTFELTRRGGPPPLFLTVHLASQLDAEPLLAESRGIGLEQALFKLIPRKTLLSGFTMDREPIDDDTSVEVGSDLEAVLTLTAERDLEYVTVTVRPAAGLEVVPVASGEPVLLRGLGPGAVEGMTLEIHRRDRDGLIRYDIPRLPKGKWSLAHELRAVVPGRFHALPAHAVAAFTPRPWGRSDELHLTVIEAPKGSVASADDDPE